MISLIVTETTVEVFQQVSETTVEISIEELTLPAAGAPPLSLSVAQAGQTQFDLGLSETRKTLWVNGVRYFEGDSYTISLPLLIWQGDFMLLPSFQLHLT